MYEETLKNLSHIAENPQTGDAGQQQHISITATLAKINIDLVNEMAGLKQTIVDLDKQNVKLTKMTTILSVVGAVIALIQVLPRIIEIFR